MASSAETLIIKAWGGEEPFEAEKLFTSLVQSGASSEDAERITARIANTLHGGESTKDIYARAFTQLRAMARPIAARYSIKHALLELGPSGYPFEDFLAALFKARGYETRTRSTYAGRCTSHEVDLVASGHAEEVMAEVKFHNSSGVKSDTKVALYVQARFEDIRSAPTFDPKSPIRAMLITNTKCTRQAHEYAACVGLELLTWEYPDNASLRILIEESGVHPVSCLTTLSRAHKRRLRESGVVLCKDLHERPNSLGSLELTDRARDAIMEEIRVLCAHVHSMQTMT